MQTFTTRLLYNQSARNKINVTLLYPQFHYLLFWSVCVSHFLESHSIRTQLGEESTCSLVKCVSALLNGKKSLKRHMESIHYGNILSCKGFTITFNRIDNFERHKRCMHIGHIMCGTADFLE